MQATKTKDMGFPFMAYMGKARALVALHRESEARNLLDEAIAQAKLVNARAEEVQLLIVLGKQAASNNPREAIAHLQEATALCDAAGLRHALAWALLELAMVYRDTDELDKAEESVAASLEPMREVEDKYHLPLHFAVLAEVLAKKGQLNAAVKAYDQAADLVNAMLVNIPSPEVESSLIAIESEVFLGRFRLAVQLKDIGKAYQILEAARGRSVADVLRSTPAKDVGLSPIAKAAQKEVNRIQIALLHSEKRAQRKRLLDRLFEAEQLLGPAAKPRNPLQKASLQTKAVNLWKLRKSLLPDEMILEYVLDEPNSYCLTITRDYSKIGVLPLGRKPMEQLIEHYLTEIKSKQPGLEPGKELNSLLLGPVQAPAGKLRLVIVPDGKLHLLPFDSLRDHEGHYVLTAHVVTYAPSATVLYLLRTSHSAHHATLPFLGVGDVPYQRTSALETAKTTDSVSTGSDASGDLFGSAGVKLKYLPGSRQEVIAAGEALGNRSILLLDEKATETAFKSQPLADFQIIHLAVHGIASTRFPDRAALVLESDPASHEDGLLQVREIRNLPLNSELVILSACDTGQGRLLGEEGVANLEQAFLLAGAKTIVASLWGADDTYTLALMKHFYRHLANRQDKGSALRQAKIDLLEEFGEQALPFYWAGFTMVGDGSRSVPIP
jgi:CHAT domain-containing protein